MKNSLYILLIAFVAGIASLNAQTISVDTDSVSCVRQYVTTGDTTGTIRVTNLAGSSVLLKLVLSYENVTPSTAATEFFYGFQHYIYSNMGIGFTDSVTLSGNDFIDMRAWFTLAPTQTIDKMKITVYVKGDSINTYQVLTFAAYNCDSPDQNIIVNPTGNYCSNDSVTLSVAGGYGNYQWSTGATTPSVYVPATQFVTLSAYDSQGCLATDTADIQVTIPYDEQICMVTVDSFTGKNMVVWEKTAGVGTAQTYIYKETFVAGVYNIIGAVPYDSLSVFVDTLSNPLQSASRYKISILDSCGVESNKSPEHKTIHLTASVGTSNENNLVWDGYQGYSFGTYTIYRGASPSSMSFLASVASTLFTYTDLTPLSGLNYYKIEAVRTTPCSPTQKASTYVSSVSNYVNLNPNGIAAYEHDLVAVYPNPVRDKLTIQLVKTHSVIRLRVYSLLGEEVGEWSAVNTNNIQLDFDQLPGVYLLAVQLDGQAVSWQKLVKE